MLTLIHSRGLTFIEGRLYSEKWKLGDIRVEWWRIQRLICSLQAWVQAIQARRWPSHGQLKTRCNRVEWNCSEKCKVGDVRVEWSTALPSWSPKFESMGTNIEFAAGRRRGCLDRPPKFAVNHHVDKGAPERCHLSASWQRKHGNRVSMELKGEEQLRFPCYLKLWTIERSTKVRLAMFLPSDLKLCKFKEQLIKVQLAMLLSCDLNLCRWFIYCQLEPYVSQWWAVSSHNVICHVYKEQKIRTLCVCKLVKQMLSYIFQKMYSFLTLAPCFVITLHHWELKIGAVGCVCW